MTPEEKLAKLYKELRQCREALRLAREQLQEMRADIALFRSTRWKENPLSFSKLLAERNELDKNLQIANNTVSAYAKRLETCEHLTKHFVGENVETGVDS